MKKAPNGKAREYHIERFGHEFVEVLGKRDCRVCACAGNRRRYQADPTRHLARQSEYQKRNAEKRRNLVADWRRKNADHNREQNRINLRARRGHVSQETREYLALIANDPCAYCAAPSETIDHIDAVSRGGSNEWENRTACCVACNGQKWAIPLLLFLARRALRRDYVSTL